jgi:hypothetical protein
MKSQLPAVDPAFWNITSNSSNSKPGDFESDMIKMLFSTGIDLQKENQALKNRINHLEAALRRIANSDYRGNRSTESQIAFEALKDSQ